MTCSHPSQLLAINRCLFHGLLIRYVKFLVAHAPGSFFPPPRVSDLDMHYGTCVTHVPWCMPGSLSSGFLWVGGGENVPGIRGACTTRNFTYLVRGPLRNCQAFVTCKWTCHLSILTVYRHLNECMSKVFTAKWRFKIISPIFGYIKKKTIKKDTIKTVYQRNKHRLQILHVSSIIYMSKL